jgi:hypothetical protein
VRHQDDNNWIDVMLTRSFDMGRTWLPVQVVHSENTWVSSPHAYQSIGQNTPVLDAHTGVVHLLFTRNNTAAFHTSSSDQGATWAIPPVPVPKPGCAACWIVRQAFPSWMRSILTEMYLCRTCSCHEISRTQTPGQAPSFSAIQLRHGAHAGDLVACLDYSELPGHQGGGPVERSGTLISSVRPQS